MIEIADNFKRYIAKTLGESEGAKLIDALRTTPETSIRINRAKPCVLPTELATNAEMVEWCTNGLRLPERPQFTLMPELHAGAFYVQDASSMIIETVVKKIVEKTGIPEGRYLDMCAAPGGKTTAAASALPGDWLVVCNEYVGQRAQILKENVCKWGLPNCVVTNSDSNAFSRLSDNFDIVAVDAPCSGEGMMRKDNDARAQWSESLIEQCAWLQRDILANAWSALKPGGYLIYSTCTFNSVENEDMCRRLMYEYGAENVDMGLCERFTIPTGLDDDIKAMRFMPHITRGEGLFMAVMRKPLSLATSTTHRNKEKKKRQADTPIPAECKSWITDSDKFIFNYDSDGVWHGIVTHHAAFVEQLRRNTRVLGYGIEIAQTKGRDVIPLHGLAMSTALSESAFPRAELSKEEALAYLRRETISLPADAKRGFLIVTYNGLPLGFVKNIGNRANNLYPQHWRIRNL